MRKSEKEKLAYLNDILQYLSKSPADGYGKSLQEIIDNVSYKEINVGFKALITKFNLGDDELNLFVFKSLVYLDKEGLVNYSGEYSHSRFSITFKGLLSVHSGGLVVAKKKEYREFNFKRTLVLIAVLTFLVNTIFQIINYFC